MKAKKQKCEDFTDNDSAPGTKIFIKNSKKGYVTLSCPSVAKPFEVRPLQVQKRKSILQEKWKSNFNNANHGINSYFQAIKALISGSEFQNFQG